MYYYRTRSENLHESERGSGESIEMKDKKAHIDPNGNPTKGYVISLVRNVTTLASYLCRCYSLYVIELNFLNTWSRYFWTKLTATNLRDALSLVLSYVSWVFFGQF